jgi:hypothetical protein
METILNSLLTYHEAFGAFPPCTSGDSETGIEHSWRALLIPYSERLSAAGSYEFGQSWDSEANQQVVYAARDLFRCPESDGPEGCGSYFAVVGPGTAWPGRNQSTSLTDVRGETVNTILIIESSCELGQWAEPVDLRVDQVKEFVKRGSDWYLWGNHQSIIHAGFADGTVRPVVDLVSTRGLESALSIADEVTIRDIYIAQ